MKFHEIYPLKAYDRKASLHVVEDISSVVSVTKPLYALCARVTKA
jgi:hypothetical protein